MSFLPATHGTQVDSVLAIEVTEYTCRQRSCPDGSLGTYILLTLPIYYQFSGFFGLCCIY